MPKDRPTKPESEGLKPLPKPIQLNLPDARPKPARRLHEPPDTASKPSRTQDGPKPPTSADKKSKSSSGKRYFDSAQKAYKQNRPRAPKASAEPKRRWWQQTSSGPILGKGDRLYTPPQKKVPLVPPRARRVLRLWPLGLIGVAILVLVVVNLFSYNAWAVYMDGRLLGHMPINREIEPESIHYDAVRHRQEVLGAEVQVNERVTVRTARSGRREVHSASDMNRLISQSFTYSVIASVIYLDGERIAVLRNAAEAQHVEYELMRRFINNDTLPGSSFEEDWQIRRIPTDIAIEDMDSPNEVIQLLERPIQDIHNHTIRSGDTQGALAIEFNTTINRIGELNDIPSDAILGVGRNLRIEITRPRLTVRTVDETTFIETVPREVETRENHNMHVAAPEVVITEGRDGEILITQRTTQLNGVQVGATEIINREVLSVAVTRVVEIGTLETVTETR